MIQDTNKHCKMIYRTQPSYNVVENSTLSPYYAANPHGDWVGMAFVMKSLLDKFKDRQLKILEVGTAHGHFLYSMKQFLKNVGSRNVVAYGIDSLLHGYRPKFFIEEGMNFIKGKSTDKNMLSVLPDDFHFVFIDGCHCQTHAYLDAKNYCGKVREGGFLGFHDTHPAFQGGTAQPNTPECNPDPSIGVVKGIEKFNPCINDYNFFLEEIPTDKAFGGIRVYERIK